MLSAEEVLQRHPHGCWVFDAQGRQLRHVFACNPDTGEVLRYAPWDCLSSLWLWGVIKAPRWAKPWLPRRIRACGCATRHGFWPAPLQLVPKLPSHQILHVDTP